MGMDNHRRNLQQEKIKQQINTKFRFVSTQLNSNTHFFPSSMKNIDNYMYYEVKQVHKKGMFTFQCLLCENARRNTCAHMHSLGQTVLEFKMELSLSRDYRVTPKPVSIVVHF